MTTTNMLKRLITLLLLFATSLSCSINDRDINGFKDNFEEHKNDFNELVTLLNSDKKIENSFGVSVLPDELSNELNLKLTKLGVTRINVVKSSCKDTLEYEFTTDWASSVTVFLGNSPCDTSNTEKGFHRKESTMIESWGLGNGWTMWIDFDFI